MEIIEHLFGICGETHLNIFSVIAVALLIKVLHIVYNYKKYNLK